MVQLTMQVSDELAKQIQPIGSWLPTIIELSLIGFKTLATATATEVIQFLSKAPSPQDVLNYHVSKQAQERLQRLLALNEAGMLSETEQLELDELQRIEHIVIMLKAQVAAQLLEKALTEVYKLPPEKQNVIAAVILEELEDEQRWDAAFAASQGQLAKLAQKVRADIKAGRVKKMGFDEL